MKFRVTYKVLDFNQLVGREPYGDEEKQVEFSNADTANEAIEFVKDSIIDKLSINQPEPLRLFDDETDNIGNAEISADIIVVNALTDKIQCGYYNFEAVPDEPIISIADYAKMHGKSAISVQQKARRGGFKTAKKIGRNWVIDSEEPYEDHRKK